MSEEPTRAAPPPAESPTGRAGAGAERTRPEPSAAEQAVANEREALESGEESPG